MSRLALALGVAALAAGCVVRVGSTGEAAASGTRLLIELWRQPELEPTRYTLECEPPGGTLAQPAEACARLAQAPDPFAPVPPGAMCTQIYGGPATAAVRGVYRGQPVSATFSRRNGCEIARYDRLVRLLGLAAP